MGGRPDDIWVDTADGLGFDPHFKAKAKIAMQANLNAQMVLDLMKNSDIQRQLTQDTTRRAKLKQQQQRGEALSSEDAKFLKTPYPPKTIRKESKCSHQTSCPGPKG